MLGKAWHKKVLFNENPSRGWEKNPYSQYVRRGCQEKAAFAENARRAWRNRAPLTQYVRRC